MKNWTKLLPLLLVEYIAKKHLERHRISELGVAVIPYKNVLFIIEKQLTDKH